MGTKNNVVNDAEDLKTLKNSKKKENMQLIYWEVNVPIVDIQNI